MNLVLDKNTWKALSCLSKTCLPWNCIYLPARALFEILHLAPEKTIWKIGVILHIRSYTRLSDGNLLFFRPFTWDHEAVKEIYGYEEYEKVFKIKTGDFVVDVGGHIGTFSIKAAQKVGTAGMVVAVEPQKENYCFLVSNKEINKLENLVPVYGALSKRAGHATLYSRSGHSGGFSIVEKHSSNCVDVPVFTLDNLVNKLSLPRIDFLKIDAEGSELAVLEGGKKILQETSAKIVVAAYHKPNNPHDISVFLQSLGYTTLCSKDEFIYAWK